MPVKSLTRNRAHTRPPHEHRHTGFTKLMPEYESLFARRSHPPPIRLSTSISEVFRPIVREGAVGVGGCRWFGVSGRVVVPESAWSYLRGALRYDRVELRTTGSAGGTTAPDYVRPRGFTYDRAGPMAHGDEAQCAGRHPPRARRRARPRQQDDAGPRPAPAPEPPTSAPRPDEKSPAQPAHTPPSQHEEPVSGPQS